MQYKFSTVQHADLESKGPISSFMRSEDFDGPKSPTEMVLHMKGPIYSVAERKISTANSNFLTQKREYPINSSNHAFVRRPVQKLVQEVNLSKSNRRSLRAAIKSNSAISGKNSKPVQPKSKGYDYVSGGPLKRIKKAVKRSQGEIDML